MKPVIARPTCCAPIFVVTLVCGMLVASTVAAIALGRGGDRDGRRGHVFYSPPPHIFIEIPVYVGREYRVYRSGNEYQRRRVPADSEWKDDSELKRTVYDLEDAFRNDEITLLSPLTDSKTKIAIFARGHYEYSLEASDYLDMTRDFMRAARTTDFNVYRVHRKNSEVYQLFAKHTYKTDTDQSRTVYLCIVVEKDGGRWTITQADSAPDHLDR